VIVHVLALSYLYSYSVSLLTLWNNGSNIKSNNYYSNIYDTICWSGLSRLVFVQSLLYKYCVPLVSAYCTCTTVYLVPASYLCFHSTNMCCSCFITQTRLLDFLKFGLCKYHRELIIRHIYSLFSVRDVKFSVVFLETGRCILGKI
jgi:hypothetical protein